MTSFKSLSTTSSIMELAMPIISNASFISGSARGLYGSGSGDSSVVIGKLLVRRQYLYAFHVQQLLQLS
jgi:hypothetical protein